MFLQRKTENMWQVLWAFIRPLVQFHAVELIFSQCGHFTLPELSL